MKAFCRISLTILIAFCVCRAFGQAASFKASVSQTEIHQGERVRVTFDFQLQSDYKVRISDFKPPPFKGFQRYAGPIQQTSFRFENGKQTQGVQYSYILVPEGTGIHTIGPASIKLEGEVMQTEPLQIVVKAAGASDRDSESADSDETNLDRDIHFVLALSDKNPYAGQSITGTYILYMRRRNLYNALKPTDFPKFPGFWNQEVKLGDIKYKQTTWRGKDYYEIVLRKVVLIPQKAGRLVIDPFEMEVPIAVATGEYDFFGRSITRSETTKVSTGSQVVHAKPLPSAGKPPNFSGAVGRFKLGVELDKTALKAGESLALRVQVSGRGNLKLFDLPKPAVPADLERYEPKHSVSVKTTTGGLVGKVADDYVLVPRYRGTYTLPPVVFDYFDPVDRKYKTSTSKAYAVRVTQGESKDGDGQRPTASASKQEVKVLGADIRYIKPAGGLAPIEKKVFFGSKWYDGLLCIPLVLIGLIACFGKRLVHRGSVDGVKMRRKQAYKRLSQARKMLKKGDNQAFYAEIERALLSFISAALRMDKSQLSQASIREALAARNVSQETVVDLTQVLDQSQFERYTAAVSAPGMRELYEKAVAVITRLNRELR